MDSTYPPPPLERSYWVYPGRFAAGVYPGAYEPDEARVKLRRMLDTGITTWIDLTRLIPPRADSLEPYAHLLAKEAGRSGLTARHLNFPIIDMSVPSQAVMRQILDALGGALSQGEVVYLHCWGGRGRTGTVVGCWLVEQGLNGAEALAEIRRLRGRMPAYDRGLPSPETPEQQAMVLAWNGDKS